MRLYLCVAVFALLSLFRSGVALALDKVDPVWARIRGEAEEKLSSLD